MFGSDNRRDAAKIANLAHARLLVFTHLLPILPNWIAVRAFLAKEKPTFQGS